MLPDHEISFCCLPSAFIFDLQLSFPQDIKICTFFFLIPRNRKRERTIVLTHDSFPVLISLLRGAVAQNLHDRMAFSKLCGILDLHNIHRYMKIFFSQMFRIS